MSSDTVKFFTGILYFSSECNFHLFLCWSSSDILLSLDWILGLALSYAVCTYETRCWVRPLPMQFEHMGSIGLHNSLLTNALSTFVNMTLNYFSLLFTCSFSIHINFIFLILKKKKKNPFFLLTSYDALFFQNRKN